MSIPGDAPPRTQADWRLVASVWVSGPHIRTPSSFTYFLFLFFTFVAVRFGGTLPRTLSHRPDFPCGQTLQPSSKICFRELFGQLSDRNNGQKKQHKLGSSLETSERFSFRKIYLDVLPMPYTTIVWPAPAPAPPARPLLGRLLLTPRGLLRPLAVCSPKSHHHTGNFDPDYF